jgi:hypothetical protein
VQGRAGGIGAACDAMARRPMSMAGPNGLARAAAAPRQRRASIEARAASGGGADLVHHRRIN